MNFFERISKIDRRIIFLTVGLAVVIPLIVPLNLPNKPSRYTRTLYEAVEAVPPRSQPILISADYSPSMMPELQPMLLAMLRHCMAKRIRVIVMTMDPNGSALAEAALREVSDELNAPRRPAPGHAVDTTKPAPDTITYGRDYLFLGYKPGGAAVIMSIGENIKQAFPADANGIPLPDTLRLPMMIGVRNYADIPLVVSLAGSGVVLSWMTYAGTRYHAPVGAGCTAVSSADYYPFLQSGQMIGLLNGMKGASEYEYLNEQNKLTTARREAGKGMDAVSIVHLLLMVFIVFGNIGYFATKAKAKH